ncbi:MAG: 7-cyano-7-deazaguanine synthase QueC [bacterium]|nr:7-cyano-7-deazaguanine synthase QueC [bacterium]
MKSVVLLSGGLDSSVSFVKAMDETDVELTLTFDYRQKSANKEIEAARRISEMYKVSHKVVELPWFLEITSTALVNRNKEIPKFDFKDSTSRDTARLVWVPNRNGVFINIAASFAEGLSCSVVVTGFNKEEGETFPDNSVLFIDAINHSLEFSTLTSIKVISFTSNLDKSEIVTLGKALGVPFRYIWSCYDGEDRMCGRCESCQRTIRAFKATDNWDLISGKFKT